MAQLANDAVRIEGLKELRKAFRNAPKELKAMLRASNREVANLVARKAETLAPRRSGRLAGTVKGSAQLDDARIKAGSARVPYAGPVHFGWSTRPDPSKGWRGGPIRPQPFLYRAASAEAANVRAAYEEQLDKLSAAISS